MHSRVLDSRFSFGVEEKERFRTLMRIMENFTGCRVLSFCLMSNHIHILLEVPAMPQDGISDGVFLERLSAIYGEGFVADVAGCDYFRCFSRRAVPIKKRFHRGIRRKNLL